MLCKVALKRPSMSSIRDGHEVHVTRPENEEEWSCDMRLQRQIRVNPHMLL